MVFHNLINDNIFDEDEKVPILTRWMLNKLDKENFDNITINDSVGSYEVYLYKLWKEGSREYKQKWNMKTSEENNKKHPYETIDRLLKIELSERKDEWRYKWSLEKLEETDLEEYTDINHPRLDRGWKVQRWFKYTTHLLTIELDDLVQELYYTRSPKCGDGAYPDPHYTYAEFIPEAKENADVSVYGENLKFVGEKTFRNPSMNWMLMTPIITIYELYKKISIERRICSYGKKLKAIENTELDYLGHKILESLTDPIYEDERAQIIKTFAFAKENKIIEPFPLRINK